MADEHPLIRPIYTLGKAKADPIGQDQLQPATQGGINTLTYPNLPKQEKKAGTYNINTDFL